MKQRCLIPVFVLMATIRQATLIGCLDETVSESVAAKSRPSAGQPLDTERRELPDEALQFIRSITILLLPAKFEDEDGWGEETRIQSGLNVAFEDGRLKTSRRWKNVNHGSWLQGSGELVEPEKTFRLEAAMLPDPGEKTHRYEVRVSTRLRVTGRQQQWNYGVMLWSISADAIADVSIRVIVDVTTEVVSTDEGTRLRFQPNVAEAAASLDEFSLRRISHAKGAAVQEFGEWLEQLIRMRVERENKDLAARINKAILKKPDRLQVPLNIGEWFGWNQGSVKDSESESKPEALPEQLRPAADQPEGDSSPKL